jgi:membrane-associated phospholipid phosphatase
MRSGAGLGALVLARQLSYSGSMRRATLLAVFLSAAGVALPARPAHADGSPYRLEWRLDLPIVGVSLAAASAAFVELPPPSCLPSCSSDGINALDRTVLGRYSPTAHRIADVTVFSMVALPLLADAIDSGGDGWGLDTAVFLETLAVTQGFTQLTKAAVRRSAPLVYNPRVPDEVKRTDPDAVRSFFSGHTATAFAAATAFSYTFWQRHPKSPWRFFVLGLSQAAAFSVGLLKIHAGYHYWTDIAAGAAAGASVGVLIPMLHTQTW